MGGIASLVLLSIVIAKVWLTPGEDQPNRVPSHLKAVRSSSAASSGVDPAGSVDLLNLVRAGDDSVRGGWGFEGASLMTPPSLPWARLKFPCRPPADYELNLVVTRRAGANSLNIGLPFGGRQVVVVLDGWTNSDLCGLDIVGGKPFYENPTTRHEKVLRTGMRAKIACTVTSDAITVAVGEKKLIDWKGHPEQVSLLPAWDISDDEALFIGSYESSFAIEQAILVCRGGAAQLLRGGPGGSDK